MINTWPLSRFPVNLPSSSIYASQPLGPKDSMECQTICLVQVRPDITRWSGSTELMRVTGEERIKYLSSQTRPHNVFEVSLGGEMLVLKVHGGNVHD